MCFSIFGRAFSIHINSYAVFTAIVHRSIRIYVYMCVCTRIVSRLLGGRRRPVKINTNVHNMCMCVITEAAEIRINGMGEEEERIINASLCPVSLVMAKDARNLRCRPTWKNDRYRGIFIQCKQDDRRVRISFCVQIQYTPSLLIVAITDYYYYYCCCMRCRKGLPPGSSAPPSQTHSVITMHRRVCSFVRSSYAPGHTEMTFRTYYYRHRRCCYYYYCRVAGHIQ